MAQLGQTFDPASAPPSDRDFDVFPAGTYASQIVESEVVKTKSGTGTLLKLTWELLDGPYANRKGWQNINIQNQSQQAQEIGQRQLAQICEAAGVGAIDDSETLHYKPVMVRWGIEKGEGEYSDKNVVKKVTPLNGAATRPAQAPQQQGQTYAGASRGADTPAAQQPPPKAAAPAGGRPWSR